MRIGHGSPGVADNLPTFEDFIMASSIEQRALVEVRPGKIITGWAPYSGATWVTGFGETFNDRILDVVGIETLEDTGLVRVETLDECLATEGTYFYDVPEDPPAIYRWSPGGTDELWDPGGTGAIWTASPVLYAHLFGDANPRETSVIAYMAFFYSGGGVDRPGGREAEVLPSLGSNKLTEVDLTEEVVDAVVGSMYRLSGKYSTPAGADPADPPLLEVGDAGTGWLSADGRSVAVGASVALVQTNGEGRRFFFDFIAPVAALTVRGSGAATFEEVELRRIWRWEFAEPRLSADAIPESEVGSNDIFFGGKRAGSGTLQLLNGDGRIGQVLDTYEHLSKEARVFVGGRMRDGRELPFDANRCRFAGLIQQHPVRDSAASLLLQDVRELMHLELPLRPFDAFRTPAMEQRFVDQPRRLLVGQKRGIRMVRIDVDASTGYPLYELADVTDAPAGLKAVDAVYAYLDDDAADAKDTARRVSLAGADYSASLTAGTVQILKDPGPYEIVAGDNDRLDFDTGGSALVANLTAGVYTAAGLAAMVQAAIRAAIGGGDITGLCTYSDTTHKITSGRGSGTFNGRLDSDSPNRDRSGWRALGFTGSTDLTGASSYVGDEALYTEPDELHIRVDAQGYKDDASGTYTGTPSALIELGADITRFVWHRFLRRPLESIDELTFAAARTECPERLAFYLNEKVSTDEIFKRIEAGCLADIVVDGAGVIYFQPYTDEPEADAPALQDHDYHTWEMERSLTDCHPSIEVRYDKDPETGTWQKRIQPTPVVRLAQRRFAPKEIETYLLDGNDAQMRAQEYAALSAAAPWRVRTSVKGRLINRRPGQTVYLTRSKAANAAGKLEAAEYRILSLRHNYSTGMTFANLLERVEI